MHEKSVEMLHKELDVVNLLKNLRKFKIIKHLALPDQHIKILKYAKNNVIDINRKKEKVPEWKNVVSLLGIIKKIVLNAQDKRVDKKVL